MKILLVNTFYYPDLIGGAEHSVKKLAEGLVEAGHDVSVLCTGNSDKAEVINNVNVYRFKSKNICGYLDYKNLNKISKAVYKIIDLFNVFNYKEINKIIKKVSPDVIHTNNLYGISPIVWSSAKNNKIPVVHTIRDYFLICSKSILVKNMKSCEKSSIQCKIYRALNRKLSENINVVTAPSNSVIPIFKKENFFKGVKSQCIFNAIDYDNELLEEVIKEKLNKQDEVLKFVYLGSLTPYKGVLILLEAFTSISNSNIRLSIAGNGELKEKVQEYCDNDDRLTYLGKIDEKQVNEVLRDADVLIAPSTIKETFGRVVLDAYKMGNPVIASDIGGLSEIVKHKKTGYLVKDISKQGFIEAIEFMNDRKVIKNMLYNCKDELQKYNIESQIKSFEDLYKSLK